MRALREACFSFLSSFHPGGSLSKLFPLAPRVHRGPDRTVQSRPDAQKVIETHSP